MKEIQLLLNKETAKKNLLKMKAFCRKNEMVFRPHFKTHQSTDIGQWFREEGIEKCTVSSLSMANYFAHAGWKDICVAIPFNIHEIKTVEALSQRLNLQLCVDHMEHLKILSKSKNIKSIAVYIEIDTGYGRSGVAFENTELIDELLEQMRPYAHLQFAGFLSHTGNSYHSLNPEEGQAIFEKARYALEELKKEYLTKYPKMILSMGDTPSATFGHKFEGIDEWRPGNFIFYDFMQYALGSCKKEEIAVKLKCPIIGIYPKRNELVIYGGGVHLSKDSIHYQGQNIYGWALRSGETIEQGFPIISLSQEHGVIKVSPEWIAKIKMGDFLEIIPIHSCMTADLNSEYLTESGQRFMKFRTY